MKHSWNLWRYAAVGSSLCLLVLFVYDRAGGNVFQKLGLTGQQTPDYLLPGSKTKAVLTIDTDSELLPGSKSAMVVVPDEPTPRTSPGSAELLPGSKSIVITPPENASLDNNPPMQRARPPIASPPQRRLLPGSKAFVIPPPEEDVPNNVDNVQQPAAQPDPLPVQRARPAGNNPPERRLLPGSKAPGTLIELPNDNAPAAQQQSNVGPR